MGLKDILIGVLPPFMLEARRKWKYRRLESLSPEEYPDELKRWFKKVSGEELDLEHPMSFNQRIQWLKLNDSTPEKGRLSDKYLVRDFVVKKVGEQYLVPLLGVWDLPDEIDFDRLPDRFVMKPTHGSGWNIIVTDKPNLDLDDTRSKLTRWLGSDFAFNDGLQLHYHYCEPRIVVEKFLENSDGGAMWELQAWCFNGKVELIGAIQSPHGENFKQFFGPDWEKLPFVSSPPIYDGVIPRPDCLDELVFNSEKMAEGLAFVRVDWYVIDGSLLFSEMTFTPAGGYVHWTPREYDLKLGSLIPLPNDAS